MMPERLEAVTRCRHQALRRPMRNQGYLEDRKTEWRRIERRGKVWNARRALRESVELKGAGKLCLKGAEILEFECGCCYGS